MLRSSSAAALCALAAIVALVAVVWGSSGAETALLRTRLREDVTSPRVRSQFLHKFNAAKSHVRAGKKGSKKGSSMLFDPLSGFKGGEGKVKGKKQLTAAQKAAIAAKMKALREKILGDFSSNTKFGKRVDCSYPYPAASCKENAVPPPRAGADPAADAIPMAFGKAR
jgi:hypothetical protein